MILFKKKVPLPVGADPAALQKIDLWKACDVILPRSNGDDAKNEELFAQYGKAKKREKQLHDKCELRFTLGVGAFINAAKTYLSDRRCLLVALFEDNKTLSLNCRRSLEELIELSKKYSILKCLSEPAKVWQEPKASGNGMRVICSFEPVARAAQRMVKKLLRLTYVPRDFQFAKLTFSQKVEHAMIVIKEKGYKCITEIDIRDFFPSFTEEALVDALPLPKEAIRHIVLAKSASWGPHPYYAKHDYILSPPGIPQGSASSAAVADWCIANMPLEKLIGSVVVNHADNFFAFSSSSDDAADVAKALSSGIARLPGGDFKGKIVQSVETKDGFQMLGCWLSLSKAGEPEADPTNANVKKLWESASRQRQRVCGRLTAAAASNLQVLRIKGLQDFLKYESMVQGWVQAFAFCGPLVRSVKDHYDTDLLRLRNTFEITDAELMPLKDASTTIKVKWYSGK